MLPLINVIQTRNACTYSRREILDWVNETLGTDITTLESLGKGVEYCKLFAKLRPSAINMSRLNFNNISQWGGMDNLALLSHAFEQCDVHKDIPIERMVSGGRRENLEFAQWFRAFFEINRHEVEKNLNMVPVRSRKSLSKTSRSAKSLRNAKKSTDVASSQLHTTASMDSSAALKQLPNSSLVKIEEDTAGCTLPNLSLSQDHRETPPITDQDIEINRQNPTQQYSQPIQADKENMFRRVELIVSALKHLSQEKGTVQQTMGSGNKKSYIDIEFVESLLTKVICNATCINDENGYPNKYLVDLELGLGLDKKSFKTKESELHLQELVESIKAYLENTNSANVSDTRNVSRPDDNQPQPTFQEILMTTTCRECNANARKEFNRYIQIEDYFAIENEFENIKEAMGSINMMLKNVPRSMVLKMNKKILIRWIRESFDAKGDEISWTFTGVSGCREFIITWNANELIGDNPEPAFESLATVEIIGILNDNVKPKMVKYITKKVKNVVRDPLDKKLSRVMGKLCDAHEQIDACHKNIDYCEDTIRSIARTDTARAQP